MQVVDDSTFAMAGVQAKQLEEEKEVALKNAESACAKAIDVLLKKGTPESQLCVIHECVRAHPYCAAAAERSAAERVVS